MTGEITLSSMWHQKFSTVYITSNNLVKVPNIVKLPYFEINETTKKTFKDIDEIEMLRSQDIEVEIHLQKQQLKLHGIPDISV